MSNKKQIEEMAKILCGMKNDCVGCMWDKVHCNERNYAEEIYNAGYRKQSEGEWITDDLGNVCTKCGRTYDPDFDIKPRMIKQFKYCPNCGAKMNGEER